MGRAIGTTVPEEVLRNPVRADIMQQISGLEIDWSIPDERMRELLITAYEDLEQNVLQIQHELLEAEDAGERYETELARVGLTGSGWGVKWHGFRTGIDSLLHRSTRPAVKRVFRWANVVLGSLSGVPGAGIVTEPLRELKESIEAAGEDGDAPREQEPPTPDPEISEEERELAEAAELEERTAQAKAAIDAAHELASTKRDRLAKLAQHKPTGPKPGP